MTMNNYIKKEVIQGCFYLAIQFKFKKILKNIDKAVYDTGCYHSCISYNLIADKKYIGLTQIRDKQLREKEKQRYIRELKIKGIFNPNVKITCGFGVESQSNDDRQAYANITEHIKMINRIKQEGLNKHKDIGSIKNELCSYITNDILEQILCNKNVKYEYKVTGYTIVNMYIGDTSIHIDYDHDNVALIGMHVIKDLDTRIFPTENGICLVATTEGAETLDKLVKDILNDDEYIDFSEQDYEANYVKSLI